MSEWVSEWVYLCLQSSSQKKSRRIIECTCTHTHTHTHTHSHTLFKLFNKFSLFVYRSMRWFRSLTSTQLSTLSSLASSIRNLTRFVCLWERERERGVCNPNPSECLCVWEREEGREGGREGWRERESVFVYQCSFGMASHSFMEGHMLPGESIFSGLANDLAAGWLLAYYGILYTWYMAQ